VTETPEKEIMRKAKAMAWSLGITVFIRKDGHIDQHPPGIAVEPPAGAKPEEAGRGPIEGTS